MEAGTSLRYFNGEDCDHREYRRWKQWVVNKMRTMDKLAEDSRGSFVWTLLSGRALEVIEHLKESDYQVKGGDKVIFDLLDKRWPELDRTDEIGENIAAVFALKATEGESVRQWCARSRETFDRCARKTGVKFPEEARGWILLNCSGLQAEQRAVVLARAQGDLKFDQVSQSMRSCFPDYVVPKKRAVAAVTLDDPSSVSEPLDEPSYDGFRDVELFLAEHGHHEEDPSFSAGDTEGFEEEEAAEILAATWKEKRAELNMVQKGRRFSAPDARKGAGASKDFKRSFRVQVEELKQRTRCRKCGKLGHWQRECRQGSSSSASHQAPSHAAGTVQVCEPLEHFVCTAARCEEHEVLLVSSPGFAVLDSGCGKTIIGRDTLNSFKDIWQRHGIAPRPEKAERNSFRYGNGEQEMSETVVDMPVFLAGRPGYVTAAVVKGRAPLLLSRPALKKLQAQVDFSGDTLQVFPDRVRVPLEVNAAGQYAIKVSDFPSQAQTMFPPLAHDEQATPEPTACLSVAYDRHPQKQKDYWEYRPQERIVIRHHRKPRETLFTPNNTQCPIDVHLLQASRTTTVDSPASVLRTTEDLWTDPERAHRKHDSKPWTGTTIFQLRPDASVPIPVGAQDEKLSVMHWTAKQHRQLMAQLQAPGPVKGSSFDIIEVFSPPRFALEGAKVGWSVLSADLCTGWDFRRRADRDALKEHVRTSRPKLLVCCPPCTWAGGWWHLNRLHMTDKEVAQREFWTRVFIQFCCELMELQFSYGGQCLFEHPKDSVAWHHPSMVKLTKFMHMIVVDMCQYGLRIPGGDLIRKTTNLLVSHECMKGIAKRCPGSSHGDHSRHQVVAGSHPQVGAISTFAGKYTPAFVKAVLRTVKGLPEAECLIVMDDRNIECLVAHSLEELNQEPEDKIGSSLRKLHNNLGHPSQAVLLRVLKHGGASVAAIDAARRFQCDQPQGSPSCSNHKGD